LTTIVDPLLSFTNIYKQCHADHSLLRKTQNTEKFELLLEIVLIFDFFGLVLFLDMDPELWTQPLIIMAMVNTIHIFLYFFLMVMWHIMWYMM
jgi:hypothetical protein